MCAAHGLLVMTSHQGVRSELGDFDQSDMTLLSFFLEKECCPGNILQDLPPTADPRLFRGQLVPDAGPLSKGKLSVGFRLAPKAR